MNEFKKKKSEDVQWQNFYDKAHLSPYDFYIENPTKENKKAILFGFNKFNNKINFGSDIGVEVINVQYSDKENVYYEALCESAFYPFEVDRIQLFSANIEQLKTLFYLKDYLSVGNGMTIPIITSDYYEQEGVLELCLQDGFKVRSSAWLEFDMLPETVLRVIIYPKKSL